MSVRILAKRSVILHWKIDRLEPGQSEKMFVRLKAVRPGTHDLDVDWTMRPQTRRMQVTVQQPELALTIDGPDEVIYGHSKTYQIRVLNPRRRNCSGRGIHTFVTKVELATESTHR